MKQNVRRILSVMLVLCMAATVVIGSATEVQAASKYKKKFSKTVKLTAGQDKELVFEMKKKGTYTVIIETKVRDSDKNYTTCYVSIADGTGEITKTVNAKGDERGASSNLYVESTKGYNKVTATVKSRGKGRQVIHLSGYAVLNGADSSGEAEVTITVKTKKANLKYKSLKDFVMPEDVG